MTASRLRVAAVPTVDGDELRRQTVGTIALQVARDVAASDPRQRRRVKGQTVDGCRHCSGFGLPGAPILHASGCVWWRADWLMRQVGE